MSATQRSVRIEDRTITQIKKLALRENRSFNNMVQVLLDRATKQQPATHKD